MKNILLKIKRQDAPASVPYWEEFEVPYRPEMTLIGALERIRLNPVNLSGEATAPVSWESVCQQSLCGSCSMLINGKLGLACETRLDLLDSSVSLEPLTSFPVVRDLVCDRSRTPAPSPPDSLSPSGKGLGRGDEFLDTCISCDLCLEACPQVNPRSAFRGAKDLHEIFVTGAGTHSEALLNQGGVDDCGNAQNCVKACPKGIPLTESIAQLKREATLHAFKKFFG